MRVDLSPVEQIGPKRCQRNFGVGLRGRGGRSAALRRRLTGKRAPVQFAVWQARQGVQHRDVCRDHRCRQPLGQVLPHVARFERLAFVDRDPRVQPSACVVIRHGDDSFADTRMIESGRLNLSDFDPVTADFDLMVRPSDKDQRAIRHLPHQIARRKEATAGCGRKRIRDKAFRRHCWPVQIPAREVRPTYIKRADNAGRNGPHVAVEHVGLRVVHGTADGRVFALGHAERRCRGHITRHLRRAI